MTRRLNVDRVNALFTEEYKKVSTVRNYDATWVHFVACVHTHRPDVISINFCIAYFRFLHDSGLAPATINSEKSDLFTPIWYGFNIDFKMDLFCNIPKSCAALNPSAPLKPISWSLSKVLDLAVSIDNESCDVKKLSQKCLCLLALASGARMSELVALVRDKNHIQVLDSGEVLLFPDPVFLAKNELPDKRWGPWRIPPLREEPSLCPVKCLESYLAKSAHYTTGQLFLGDEGSKLTLKQLKAKLLYFIKLADPNSVPTGHEVRKVASSMNFFEFMDFGELCKYTGWKSTRVFFRHYLRKIEELKHNVVAAGKVIRRRPSAGSSSDSS